MTKQKRSMIYSFIIGVVILVGLDQWTKGLAVAHLKNKEPAVVWKGDAGEAAVLFPDCCPGLGRCSVSYMENAG